MSDYPHQSHGRSFLLKESLRKSLHAYSGNLDDHFHGSWVISSVPQREARIPRAQFDAWVTFQTWFAEGEPVTVLESPALTGSVHSSTGENEGYVLETWLRDEAMAFRLGEGEDWIILARHSEADGRSEINEGLRAQYGSPALTFVWNILGVRGAGAIALDRRSRWNGLQWPEGDACDPITEQRRVLTKRVKATFLAAAAAALREFSKAQSAADFPRTRP